ncbi:CG30076 [Drosophila busckii]|uniref:CG30076 n=1 Tax=Drosophila busckii TaxID=30019 RepID=A0A0M3QV53_DROBS|nr:uncharacterized protein LOC108596984 [Drosophila busckii]ALC41783.1 CG30076 [Drosophila busckii]
MRKHCITHHNCLGMLLVTSLLLLLQQVNAEQQAEDHRIQRRFMWQQMDNSVMGGLMGRMFNGARAMKSMFGDLLPSTAGYAKSMMDFLPTETTRVKYVIRDPHTNKPMKIIKMRGSQKKIVKLIRPLPKPAVTEPSKLQYEHRMRQLEKEQELIVEGKAPMSSDEALMEKYFKQKTRHGNDIVSGKIMEYQSWKPVYKAGEQPSSFVTVRPQALTQLHTSITSSSHESLPKPEKLVAHKPELEEDEDDDFEQVEDGDMNNENELGRPMHQYEVTEHTGEASGEVRALAPLEGGFVPSKLQSSNQHAPRPRTRIISSSSSTTTSSPSSSTTEAPNYPAAFLKKYREHEATAAPPKHSKSRVKPHKLLSSENGSPSMSSLRARLQEQQRQHKQQVQQERDAEMEAALEDAMHGDKWPTEVQLEHSGSAGSSSSYLTSPIGPSAVAFEQPLKLPRKEYKKPQPTNVRQRGSIKFSNNPNYDEV